MTLLAVAAPVRAAEITNCIDLDPDVAECGDLSEEGFLDFELSILAPAEIDLTVETTAGERAGDSLVLRAALLNDSILQDEVDLARVELRLDGGARFAPVGTVRNFDLEPVPVTRPDDVTALIEPSPPLPPADLLEIGDFYGDAPGATNWEIDLSQLVGASFVLRVVAVPEPPAAASLACALLVLAALAGRRG